VSVGAGVSVGVAVAVAVAVGARVSVGVSLGMEMSGGTKVSVFVAAGVDARKAIAVADDEAVDVGASSAGCVVALEEALLGVAAADSDGVSVTAEGGATVRVAAEVRVAAVSRVCVERGVTVAVANSTPNCTWVLVGAGAAGGLDWAATYAVAVAPLTGVASTMIGRVVAVGGAIVVASKKTGGVGAPVEALPVLAATGVQVAPKVSVASLKPAGSVREMVPGGDTLGSRSEVVNAMAARLTTSVKTPPMAVQMRCSEVSLNLPAS
jgi:hypothetical protein